jgi:hypothetical protein
VFDGFPAVPLIGFGLLRAKASSERQSLGTGAAYPKKSPDPLFALSPAVFNGRLIFVCLSLGRVYFILCVFSSPPSL